MGLPVVTVASGGLPVVESTVGGTPVTEAANGRGVPVTKVAARGLPVVFETIGVAAPFIGATLNGTPTGAVSVTNGGLTATHGSTANSVGVPSLSFQSNGKYYFEAKIVSITSSMTNGVGLKLAVATFGDLGSSGINGFVVLFGASNIVYNNGSMMTPTLGSQLVANDVIGMAIDLTARLGWARKNNGLWNASVPADPATGAGGVAVLAGSLQPCVRFTGPGVSDATTVNFGQSAFIHSVPFGFTSGWPA